MGAISLYARPSAGFKQKLEASKALLNSAATRYAPLTQASSLGAEDMVMTHLIAETGIASGIFVLDTRMLHAQTLALVDRLEERYGRKVDIYRPDPSVAAKFVAEFGEDAMYKSPELRKACCDFRKMVPLERALAGKQGWITGLRREQSNARSEVHGVEQQNLVIDGLAVSRTKINPLADWTWGDVWHFISLHNIPYNPLHDEFFPSIGCAPCTRAVTLGEDVRSGRWWWEKSDLKECGLHADVASAGSSEPQEPAAFEPLSSVIPSREASRSTIIPIREISA